MTTNRASVSRGLRWTILAAFLAAVVGGSWVTARWIRQAEPGTSTGSSLATASPGASAAAGPSLGAAAAASGGPSSDPSPSRRPAAEPVPAVRILFASDSSALTPASKGELDRLVTLVKASPMTFVIVQGHSDSRGSSAAKQRASMLRAHVVEDYLRDCGVPRERLSHTTFSDSRPAASGSGAAALAASRRVDVFVRDLS